jgi:hypothetical protein
VKDRPGFQTLSSRTLVDRSGEWLCVESAFRFFLPARIVRAAFADYSDSDYPNVAAVVIFFVRVRLANRPEAERRRPASLATQVRPLIFAIG